MIPTQSELKKFFALEGKELQQPEDYTEAFNLIQRLDRDSTYYFDDMMKYADRINQENLKQLDDAMGELQEAIQDSRVEIQKRIMEVYRIIAMEDGQ
jgi:gas vesicle protein